MVIGDIFLWVSAAGLIGAFFIYLTPAIRHTAPPPFARWSYIISSIGLSVASLLLLGYLLSHRFDIAYVYGYTSRDLPLGYIISAFWAGPEGSFLFWALVGAWVGVFVAKTAKDLEATTMLFWCLAQGLLVVMLIAHSPFFMFDIPSPPPDGAGLNPILQDPWMAIHPPVTFLGFVGMTVPACFAAGALLAGKYDRWSNLALPWASFGWLTLGAGLVLGGLWAYEVLGWGGYWGWDPVENSSLVPWITGTILLHGLIMEKRRNTSQRPNYIFAMLTYILVLYSTFLTRSGILGDFSVHSFSDLGVTRILATLIITMIVIFTGLFLWRIKNLPAPAIVEKPDGKEINHYATVWILSAIAFLVLLGTSAPLLTGLLNPDNPQAVQTRFYNFTSGPFALVMLVLVALCPFMAWSPRGAAQSGAASTNRWLGLVLFGAAIGIIILLLSMGISSGTLWALGILAAIASILSLVFFFRTAAVLGVLAASVYLAHAGFAMMFIGIAGSNLGRQDATINMVEGQEPAQALGWTVNLLGVAQDADGTMYAGLEVSRDGGPPKDVLITGKPMPSGSGYAYKPYINRGALQDIYFAPQRVQPPTDPHGHHHHDHAPVSEVVPIPDSQPVEPYLVVGSTGVRGVPVPLPDDSGTITLNTINVETRSVNVTLNIGDDPPNTFNIEMAEVKRIGDLDIQFQRFGGMAETEEGMTAAIVLNVASARGDEPHVSEIIMHEEDEHDHDHEDIEPAFVVMTVSNKPLVSVLWLGCIIMGIGSLLAVLRRFREAHGV